jgi:hypothetical protein
MSGDRSRVPTLTEVVLMAEPDAVDVPLEGVLSLGPAPAEAVLAPHGAALPITEEQLVRQVLADVQRQIELMLEVRLRETLAPILARATDALLRDTRNQLSSTLHEVVSRAVAQELSRHRDR